MALLTSFNEWHCRPAWVGTHLVAILFHNNQNELGYFIILCYIVGIYLYFLCSMYIWIGLLSLFVVLSMVAICPFWRCKKFLCQSLKRFQNILIRYCFVFLASRALHLVCRSLFWSSDRLVGTLISSASILILYLKIRKATRPRLGGLAPLHLQNGFFVKNKARLKSCCSLCKFIPIRLIVNW